jgi:hypothetical protein
MSDLIDYMHEEERRSVIHEAIVGKGIESDYYIFVKGKVLEVGYDSNGPYIIVEGKERYKISSEIFRFFKIID